ncbi:MAG: hypothetical protein K6B52_04880 [Clostridiales bacterium]|nr:hypothetical protein [Clostridiales bacterium]
MAENKQIAEKVGEVLSEKSISFVCNFEQQNFVEDMSSPDGFQWAEKQAGCHRAVLPSEFCDSLNKYSNCDGFMYDELEHCIINRNVSIYLASKLKKDLPVFEVIKTSSLLEQGELLDKQLGSYVDQLKAAGAKTVSGEHVFPVLFHRFAKTGIIPNFKSQKESMSNIQFAIAAGAALQYKTPLWNCVDLWCRMTFPGHSERELYSNLEFAYYAGVNRVYVEALSGISNGEKLNSYGETFMSFLREYSGKERNYDITSYKPQVGIIRYDDSFWGQGATPVMWRNMLLGNPALKVKKENREWVHAFNVITHGESGNGGLSYDRVSLWLIKKHRSFASMNSAVVFDDNSGYEDLKTLKLCFLCGPYISEKTLSAVQRLVTENGLTVVTKKKYLPEPFVHKKSINVFSQGSGKWISVNSFKNPALKTLIEPLLGEKGYITLNFAEKDLKFRISTDGETIKPV